MEAVFIALIEKLNSSVFVLLVLLLLAFYACYKITSIVTNWNVKREYSDKRLEKMEDIHDLVTKDDIKLENIDKRLEKIENIYEIVISTRERIQMLYEKFISGTVSNPLIASRSPIKLTDEGEEVAKEIDAQSIFNRHIKSLINRIDEENPQTAYDIQTVSFRLTSEELPKMLSKEEMAIIKNSAFNRGIQILNIWVIFGIYLRDKILNDRGVIPSDLDKT